MSEQTREGDWRHVGWPPDLDDVLDRVRRGLPSYWPTNPAMSNQTRYLEYLKKEKKPQ